MHELVSVFRSYKLKSNYQEKQTKPMMETKKRYIILPNSNCTKNLKLTVKEERTQTRKKIAPKVQMPRWNDTLSTNKTIHHSTNTADACIQDFCTAITMQCFSYAIRSQSVLTTILLGVSTMFSTAHAY